MKGFGKFTWPDGRSYEGNFESDKMTHQGLTDPDTGRRILATFRWPDKRLFKGDFQNGVQQGLGCLYGPDGSVLECGDWDDGKLVTSMEEKEFLTMLEPPQIKEEGEEGAEDKE